MPENTGKTEKKILVEGWRSKVSEQKKKRRMKQFLFVVVTACILCGMCVVVLASNPVVSKQGVELAVNLTRAMIAMVFAMFCGITQFRLVKEMEEQFDQMQEIVETF